MNRIEATAAQQVSQGMTGPLGVVSGIQPISCTPTVALAVTVAALVTVVTGGGYLPGDGPGDPSDGDRPDALSSNDLIGAVRAAQSA